MKKLAGHDSLKIADDTLLHLNPFAVCPREDVPEVISQGAKCGEVIVSAL